MDKLNQWKQKDSNLRTPKRPDLQSGAVATWLYFQLPIINLEINNTNNGLLWAERHS